MKNKVYFWILPLIAIAIGGIIEVTNGDVSPTLASIIHYVVIIVWLLILVKFVQLVFFKRKKK